MKGIDALKSNIRIFILGRENCFSVQASCIVIWTAFGILIWLSITENAKTNNWPSFGSSVLEKFCKLRCDYSNLVSIPTFNQISSDHLN